MKHCNIKPIDWEFSLFKKFVKKGYYDKIGVIFIKQRGRVLTSTRPL